MPHPHPTHQQLLTHNGLVCDESFIKVISVSLHTSVITQDGYSALMMAAQGGKTEVVPLLLEAGADIDLQSEVYTRKVFHWVFS